MCGGVEAREADKVWKIYFPNPKAAIPVLLEESGQLDWIHWGRRKEELGTGPRGGWARLSTVQSGSWEKYRPRRGFGMVQSKRTGITPCRRIPSCAAAARPGRWPSASAGA